MSKYGVFPGLYLDTFYAVLFTARKFSLYHDSAVVIQKKLLQDIFDLQRLFLKVYFVLSNDEPLTPTVDNNLIKVELSPSKKQSFIYFNESPLKMMKNAFCLTLIALFVLKIFKFLSRFFSYVEKTA